MRRIAVVLILLALITPAGWAQKKKPPEFDSKSPVNTAMWLEHIVQPYAKTLTQKNALAKEAATKAVNAKVMSLKGKTIRWPCRISYIDKDGIMFRVAAEVKKKSGPYTTFFYVTIEEFESKHPFVLGPYFPLPNEKWVITASRNDIVYVEGTIVEARSPLSACDDGSSPIGATLAISINNVKLTYVGLYEKRVAPKKPMK